MVDDMISKTPLVEESSRPSQVGNEAGQGELGPLHHLLAATDQRRVAWTVVTDHFCPVCFKSCTWWVQDHQLNWLGHWTWSRCVHPDTGEVAMEVPRHVLQEQLARVDVAQVLVVTIALGKLLQQVLVHVPGLWG